MQAEVPVCGVDVMLHSPPGLIRWLKETYAKLRGNGMNIRLQSADDPRMRLLRLLEDTRSEVETWLVDREYGAEDAGDLESVRAFQQARQGFWRASSRITQLLVDDMKGDKMRGTEGSGDFDK